VSPARQLSDHRHELVRRSVELVYERLPELEERYGPAGRLRCAEDAEFHLGFLVSAVAIDEDAVFADYARWAGVLLERFAIPRAHLVEAFRALAAAVEELAPGAAAPARRILLAGEAALAD
jgi:hypothetical protein